MTITLHSRVCVCACVLSACRWTWPLRTPSAAVRKNSVPLRWVSGGSSSVCSGLCFLVVAFRVRGWAKGNGGRWGRGWGNIGAHGVSGKGKSMEVGVSCGLILEQGGDSTSRAMLWRSETQLFPPLTTLPFYSQPLYEGCLWQTILFVNWKQLTYTIKSTISHMVIFSQVVSVVFDMKTLRFILFLCIFIVNIWNHEIPLNCNLINCPILYSTPYSK